MIPDRMIEPDTLTLSGPRASVEVRIPWYRALPASCIRGAKLAIDGTEAPQSSLRWKMNGREFTFDEMRSIGKEWWFPLDSAVLSGDIAPASDQETHRVDVELTLYLPYLVLDSGEVLHIVEHDSKIMKVVAA